MSISEILKKLLGEIEPVGETNEDNKRFNNIQNYYETLSFILAQLSDASRYKDKPQASLQRIGEECYDILKEYNIEE